MAVTPGLASKLQLKIVSTYTDIAQCVSFDLGGWSVGEADTTHLGSTIKTARPTIADSGEIKAQILYDASSATHAALTTLMITPVVSDWKIIMADTGACDYAFSGFLKSFDISGFEAEGNVVADISIKVTTVYTITP